MNQRLEKIQKEKQKKVIRFFYLVLIAFVSFSCTIKNNVIKSNYTIQNAEYFILKEEYNITEIEFPQIREVLEEEGIRQDCYKKHKALLSKFI